MRMSQLDQLVFATIYKRPLGYRASRLHSLAYYDLQVLDDGSRRVHSNRLESVL